MKATLSTMGGRLTFEVDADTSKDLFEQIGSIQEVFDAEQQCGCCESDDIHFVRRETQGFDFYELHCQACRARFCFGQSKDKKNLFPKRRENGKELPHGGWSRYNPQTGEDDEAESQRGRNNTTQARQSPPASPKPNGNGNGHGTSAAASTLDEMTELKAIDKDQNYAAVSFQKLMERMIEVGGHAGSDRYDVVADQFRREYPRGAGREALKNVVRQLFSELRTLEGKVRR